MKKSLISLCAIAALLPAVASACETGHWIKSVSNGGEIIILEDNSVWQIDSVDRIDTALWLPVTNIAVCYGELINTDDGERAAARRLR